MKKFLKSLFTDAEWDYDISKVVGFIMVIIGFIGYFMGKDGWQWIIITGGGAIASGKLSGNE